MIKKLLALLLLLAVLLPMAQAAPYTGYYYDSWGEVTPCPSVFEAEKEYLFSDMGLTQPLSSPSDLCIDGSGMIYIADTGNNRIVVLDQNLGYAKELNGYTEGVLFTAFSSPKGISVDCSNNYVVADTGAFRVERIAPDGSLISVYTQPESELYPSEIPFQPVKAASDLEDNIYALVPSVYQGIVLFTEDGEFLNFFGSNTVHVTASLLLDYYWKKLLSKEQAEKMARYVPVNYLSMDMTDSGYLFVTEFSESSKRQIKKLNALGNNILRVEQESKARYGDLDIVWYKGNRIDTQLCDIAVDDETGIIYALDSERGRIFAYDQSSDNLGVFGGSGSQTGLFSKAAAIECFDGKLYVLDSVRGSVTVFRPTLFGANMIEAVALYEQGRYDESEKLWRNLLARSENLEIAYDGIGKAMLARREYGASLPYFEKANDTYWYSKAFTEYRVEQVRRVLPAVLLGAVIIFVLILVLKKCFGKKRRQRRQTAVTLALRTLFHPISGYEEIHYKKSYSRVFALVILALWFICAVTGYQYTDFLFNGHKPDSINVLLIFVKTIGLFVLLVLINNALSTFLDGESTLRQLWICCAYAMMPIILCDFAVIGLSYCLTLEESVVLGVLRVCGYVWSLWEIISVMMAVQQYTFKRSLAALLCTAAGAVIVLFIVFLFASLIGQVGSFFGTVFDEILLW